MSEQNYIPNEASRTRRLRAPLRAELPAVEQPRWLRAEFPFDGAWINDEDPIKIGLGNFAAVQNLRYTDGGLEGVSGYTKINTTPLTLPRIRNGTQLIKMIEGVITSYIIVQHTNADQTVGNIRANRAIVPATGEFDTNALYVESAGFELGRFALAPDGNVVYCNGTDTLIWGTGNHRVGAVINYEEGVFRFDITERMQSVIIDTPNIFTLGGTAGGIILLLIGSVRPIQGIYYRVITPNAGASTATVEYWNGSTWAPVGGFVDGTSVGGVTMAQTGNMTFTSTVTTALPKYSDGRLLYFYRVTLGGTPDGTITLSHINVNPPMQSIIDVWDGVERTCIQFQYDNATVTKARDYTLEVQEPSSAQAPIGAEIGDFAGGGDYIIVGFEDQMTAIKVRVLAEKPNSTASTLTVSYWAGGFWATVTGLVDGTVGLGGASLNHTGAISWTAPNSVAEFQQELYGVHAYFYRLTWSAGFSGTNPVDIIIDTVTGIPAQRWNAFKPALGYRFPFIYQGRVMLANKKLNNEANVIDYSVPDAPDAWNGETSSDHGKEIRVGNHEGLTAAIEISNIFSGILRVSAIVTKLRQTWVLSGDEPDNFQLFQLSSEIGCPCPLTMVNASFSVAVDQQTIRNTAVWVSHAGPVMSDGGIIRPLRFTQRDGHISSIENFFNPNDPNTVTVSAFENARGWYDATHGEYNVLLPTGGSAVCNRWFVADLRRQKWFEKVPTTYPTMGINILNNTGGQYTYAGTDTGLLLRLENGTTWDGTAIGTQLITADMLPTSSAWDITLVRQVKLLSVSEAGNTGVIGVTHAMDGTGTFFSILEGQLTGAGRWQKTTAAVNKRGFSHQFRFTTLTTDKARAPQLLGWGYQYRIEREDLAG